MTELTLTEKERQVVLEVLEAKQRQLQFETRRTESFQMHDELREDLRAVDRLIERLQNAERMTRLPVGDVGGSSAG
ncbi:MAG TPA: hypothetical protein VFB66_17100 [Tepidisphaeraceae bacterium]|nr:hypothetical protein [Tepidisphaeraceae bacterium]